jgi:hypothetical protein
MSKKKRVANQPGTNETVMEMAAEMHDPAMWATLQLTKPTAEPPKTIGDVHERICSIFRQAIDMELRRLGVHKCEDCDAITQEEGCLCSECRLKERTLDRMP